jgi:PKD repeat protein
MKKTMFFLGLLAMLCAGCRPDVESCFTATITGGTATFSSACAIEAVTYNWEFGDGGTSIAANPTHTYTASGTYAVTLRVEDKKGRASTYSSNVVISTCSLACVHGQCVNGACACEAGYEGVDCSAPVNAKFTGIYSCLETCSHSGILVPYPVQVLPVSGTILYANIQGLWELINFPVNVEVNANGLNFTIPRQAIDTSFDLACTNGTITASGNTINLVYTIYATGTSTVVDVCTATLTR